MKAQARLRSNGDSGRWSWIVKHDDGSLYLGTIYITMKDACVLNKNDIAHLEKHDHLLEIDYVGECNEA
jgi:hypothetical protein